ncbi:hypothetical protein BCR39DRAFT_507209 [Naematelia encephala]|uniref:Transcription factor domain-containing protein n=1 Tax=Naematelia encephala TaxID=71784 RepID=A0A1Y2AR55_9TREE|nr:hypothetical protein BCR39DRAFT_507209 [Naematelia encephala]
MGHRGGNVPPEDAISDRNLAGKNSAKKQRTTPAVSDEQVEQTLSHGQFDKAPIQTLRGLLSTTNPAQEIANDPIALGVLAIAEAQRICKVLGHGSSVSAPSIVTFGLPEGGGNTLAAGVLTSSVRSQQYWLHPRYADLLSIFDDHIKHFVIHPNSSDFTLKIIQALLLTTQWPPLDLDSGKLKSRFNDAYAWLMVGLATRLAKYIDLERCTETTFDTDEERARMRVWLNLVSVDRHCGPELSGSLTMTAGLPATLSAPPSKVLRTFGSHPKAQTGDLKLAGLAELIPIVEKASVACGDVFLRQLDPISLGMVTVEMDAWEKSWSTILQQSPNHLQQMPFGALKWYRLALNAIPIAAELGEIKLVGSTVPAALGAAVQAAYQLLW